MAKSQIFVSYAHEDADWKDRVLAPLRALERNGHFHIWADSRLEAGDEWEREIETAIEHSDAAVLLISNAFLGSEFINGKEVPRILKQRKADGMRVFPLILKPCPWEDISWLNSLQVRPEKARPLVRASQWDVRWTTPKITTTSFTVYATAGSAPTVRPSSASRTRSRCLTHFAPC